MRDGAGGAPCLWVESYELWWWYDDARGQYDADHEYEANFYYADYDYDADFEGEGNAYNADCDFDVDYKGEDNFLMLIMIMILIMEVNNETLMVDFSWWVEVEEELVSS